MSLRASLFALSPSTLLRMVRRMVSKVEPRSNPIQNMKDDKTIARIRAVRRQISEKFGHDIERLGKYYMKRQARQRNKLLSGFREALAH